MGTTDSKGEGEEDGTKHQGDQGAAMVGHAMAVNLPSQQPYSDTPVRYHYMEMEATLDINNQHSFTQPVSFNSNNLDSYYPKLASMYQQGYRMLVFVALPGQTKTYGFFSKRTTGDTQVTTKFQGIFLKLFPEELGQQWELKVEKSMLVNHMFFHWKGKIMFNSSTRSEIDSDDFHIMQTIDRISEQGGRLVSAEMTGMAGNELLTQRP